MTETDQNALYPFEVIVQGTPISLQGSRDSKERWKATVKTAGQDRAHATDEIGFLYPTPVALTIFYLPAAPMAGDVDNIVKPIMDALINVAYPDDRLVERIIIQKFEPGFDWEFVDPSDQLAAALEAAPPVVYIKVVDDLSWRQAQ